MPTITTGSGRTGRWPKMLRSLVRFSGSGPSSHTRYSAVFITITFGFEFSVHTSSFEQLWTQFFEARVGGQDSFEYFVDHCLMRPRFLLNIIENAIANGINRGHSQARQEDCVDAVRQHSLYLINDFGYEIRDVSGLPPEILYSLVGATKFITHDEIIDRFRRFNVAEKDLETAFRLMLWYGVLGVAAATGAEHFIYDYDYDMLRLEAEIRSSAEEVLYVTNPALHVGMRA